ncbi:hypothetical protein [Cohnella sp. 56]|uniref:hypothetical protein n=1 Tax=Cohnella sp. 56 TaxID=3113722 RepID=UPI0030EA39F3
MIGYNSITKLFVRQPAGPSGGRHDKSDDCRGRDARANRTQKHCFNSPEGGRLLYTGVKGVDWDIVDGKPQLMGEYAKPNPSAEYQNSVGANDFYKALGAFASNYPDEEGYPLDLKQLVNPSTITVAEKEFADHFAPGTTFPGEAYDKLIKDGKLKSATNFSLEASLVTYMEPERMRGEGGHGRWFGKTASALPWRW